MLWQESRCTEKMRVGGLGKMERSWGRDSRREQFRRKARQANLGFARLGGFHPSQRVIAVKVLLRTRQQFVQRFIFILSFLFLSLDLAQLAMGINPHFLVPLSS